MAQSRYSSAFQTVAEHRPLSRGLTSELARLFSIHHLWLVQLVYARSMANSQTILSLIISLLVIQSDAAPIQKRQAETSLSPMLIVVANWNEPVNKEVTTELPNDAPEQSVENQGDAIEPETEQVLPTKTSSTDTTEADATEAIIGEEPTETAMPAEPVQPSPTAEGSEGNSNIEGQANSDTAIAEETAAGLEIEESQKQATSTLQEDTNPVDNARDSSDRDSEAPSNELTLSSDDANDDENQEEDSIEPTATDSLDFTVQTTTDDQGNPLTLSTQAPTTAIPVDGDLTPEEAAFRSQIDDYVAGANIEVTREGDDNDDCCSGLFDSGNTSDSYSTQNGSGPSSWQDYIFDGSRDDDPDLANINWLQIALPDPADPKSADMAKLIKESEYRPMDLLNLN